MNINTIIVKPVITEKSMQLAQNGKFTFMVHRDVKKEDIKKAVEKQFNVHITHVSTNVTKGRSTRAGARRLEITFQPFKKAVVSVKSGEKIDLFDIAA